MHRTLDASPSTKGSSALTLGGACLWPIRSIRLASTMLHRVGTRGLVGLRAPI
jgi:hypothetical protein